MPRLHAAVDPQEHGMLAVGDGHHLYWETVGSPDGTPAVYLHGGPGGGAGAGARRYFDPTAYRAAQAHPQRVRGVVLGAVTSGTRRETDWITRGVGPVFPRAWRECAAHVPPAEREGDLAAAYARLLASDEPGVAEAAARSSSTGASTSPDRRRPPSTSTRPGPEAARSSSTTPATGAGPSPTS